MATRKMRLPKIPTSDKVLSISAILISLATFFMFSYQTRLMQRQAYAAALPYLEIYYTYPDSTDFSFMLVNSGVGPAFIREYYVEYQDSTYHLDPGTFIVQKFGSQFPKGSFLISNLRNGRLIPAGGQVSLVSAEDNLAATKLLADCLGEQKAKVVVRYASVFDDEWIVEGMLDQPLKLD